MAICSYICLMSKMFILSSNIFVSTNNLPDELVIIFFKINIIAVTKVMLAGQMEYAICKD